MQSLYRNGLEYIYDAMYRSFINYKEEYNFYNSLLEKYHLRSTIEIGCGTGNLAKLFIENQKDYRGLDLSEDMIKLSKTKNKSGLFLHGDMSDFKLENKPQSAIITGRTTSYLTDNKRLNTSLSNISSNLQEGGYLIFDFIDAVRFFKEIKHEYYIEHACTYEDTTYKRESKYSVNRDDENLMFNWKSKYFKLVNGKKQLLVEDDSNVRAFTIDEWRIFLTLNNFLILECIDRPSYAFDTYVIIARKTSS